MKQEKCGFKKCTQWGSPAYFKVHADPPISVRYCLCKKHATIVKAMLDAMMK